MPDKLLTTREIEDLLRLDRVTIYKLVKEGELPARRIGGQWRFSQSAVQSWLEGHSESNTTNESARLDQAAELSLHLTDLIPLETLQTIQNQFAHLLRVASFTLDRHGVPFAACSRCSGFCQLVHSTPLGFDACRETWRAVALGAEDGGHTYSCHAGIQYASAPIIVNGQCMGMVTAGQFLTEDPDPETLAARAQATGRRIGVDGEALAATGASLEIVDTGRALEITSLLATIANALSAIGYQSYLLRQKLAQIAQISGGEEASG